MFQGRPQILRHDCCVARIKTRKREQAEGWKLLCYAMLCNKSEKKKSQELCVLGTVKSTTHLTGVCSDQPEQLPRDQRKQSSRREEHPWDRYRGNLRRPGIKRLNGKHNEREPRQRRSEVKGEEEEFEGDTAWIIKS